MAASPPDRLILRGEFAGRATDHPFDALPGQWVRVGREHRDLTRHPLFGSDLVFAGDLALSNHHAELSWDGAAVQVRKRPDLAADIQFLDPPRAAAEGAVPVGGQFRLGQTLFTVLPAVVEVQPTAADLRAIDLSQRNPWMAALAGLLDDARTAGPTPDGLLAAALAGVTTADVAAVVDCPQDPAAPPAVAHVRLRGAVTDWRPSRRLVRRAAREFLPVAYAWSPDGPAADSATKCVGTTWAVCVRLPAAEDRVLYLAGGTSTFHARLDHDMRFAQLLADVYAGQVQLRAADAQARFLRRFVPQPVRAAVRLAGTSPEQATAAKPADATVLFCDLRGFTPAVESGANDLEETWGTLSVALGMMTTAIVQAGGLVGDFQGDAVMAFWGWPQPTCAVSPEAERARIAAQIRRAAEAALAIRRQFVGLLDQPNHPLAEVLRSGQAVPIGIGIAHGPALAGRLGTGEQLKFGVFGPAVNRAARLEAATKKLRVPILVGGEVLEHLTGGGFRTRSVGRFRLQGLADARLVGELLPAEDESPPNLSEDDRRRYAAALARLEAGDWVGFSTLSAPLVLDGPTDYLRRYVAAAGQPPAGWDGAIVVDK